jgi:hypothetical protein
MDAVGDPHHQKPSNNNNNSNSQSRNADDDNHATIQEEDENDLFLTNTIADAARAIRHDSFAVYKVPSHTAQAIRVAWTEARKFFAMATTLSTSTTNISATIDTSIAATARAATGTSTKTAATETQEKSGSGNSSNYIIHQGQLHGLYEPSAAKYLYRAFCSSPHQPWPAGNNSDSNKFNMENGEHHHFRQASIEVAQELHQILMDCLAQIEQQESQNQYQPYNPEPCHHGGVCGGGGGSGSENDESSSPKRKRPRHEFQLQTNESQSSPITVPTSALDPFAQCPLDYFLYHGQQERRQHQHQAASHQRHGKSTTTKVSATGNPNTITTPTNPTVVVPNCTAHVDRGLLIVVCLTNVPGLEVWSRRRHGGSYLCPEILSHHATLYQELEPCAGGEYVCIMAGDQLSDYCCQPRMTMAYGAQQQRQQPRRRLNACVHRVRSNLPQARLSISYELRGVQRQTHSAG